jgi:hypothetical protein
MRPPIRSLFLAILLTALVTASVGLPSAAADPEPTPEPTPSPSPTSEPSPDPEPTETPSPSPPPEGDDPSPSPSPSPSPDGDGKGQDRDKQSRETDQRGRRQSKKDPFALHGPRNTAKLVSILTAVTPRGMSLKEALLKVVGPFPVAGLAWWSHDWHAPRCCPFPHLHQGIDIFAPAGTPLVAAADGYISQKVNSPSASGLGLEITDARNIQYFYAHLSAFEPGIEVGTQVELGQVIGYVGDTGNARGTIPHLHFERQPDGVPAPPKPWVDRWLKIAEQKAIELVEEVTGKRPKVDRLTFRLTRLFDLVDAERTDLDNGAAGDAGELPVGIEVQLGATYPIARDTAGTMAWEINWGEQAADLIATSVQEYQRGMTEQTLVAILQDAEARQTELPGTGLLPGSPGVVVAEGIGDPTAPLVTDANGAAVVPGIPGAADGLETGAEAALPPGAIGRAIASRNEPAETSTSSSVYRLDESGSRPSWWRAVIGPGLARVVSLYEVLSRTLPRLTQTLGNEIVGLVEEKRGWTLLRAQEPL